MDGMIQNGGMFFSTAMIPRTEPIPVPASASAPKREQPAPKREQPDPDPDPDPDPAPKCEEPTVPLGIIATESTKWSDLSLEVSDLTISSNYGNDLNALDLNRFDWLRSIEIGDDCFKSVKTFKIDGLNRLKTIKIGNNSFTQKRYGWGNDESKSFHILNCESLESIQIGKYSFSDFAGEFELKNLPQLQSIQIGKYSFSDFAGEFELKNLPQLQSIQIGTIGSYSYNFCNSSFVIRGIELILNIVMIRSS